MEDVERYEKALKEGKHISFEKLKELAGDMYQHPEATKWHTAIMVLKPKVMKKEYRTPDNLAIVIGSQNKVFGSFGGYSLFGTSIQDIKDNYQFGCCRWENALGNVKYCVIVD